MTLRYIAFAIIVMPFYTVSQKRVPP